MVKSPYRSIGISGSLNMNKENLEIIYRLVGNSSAIVN